MKTFSLLITVVCLALCIVPSVLVYLGIISLDFNKTLMLIGTIGWFMTAPFWMNKKREAVNEN